MRHLLSFHQQLSELTKGGTTKVLYIVNYYILRIDSLNSAILNTDTNALNTMLSSPLYCFLSMTSKLI